MRNYKNIFEEIKNELIDNVENINLESVNLENDIIKFIYSDFLHVSIFNINEENTIRVKISVMLGNRNMNVVNENIDLELPNMNSHCRNLERFLENKKNLTDKMLNNIIQFQRTILNLNDN